MSSVQAHVDAPPERVFEVLADPRTYSEWVVGARSVERHDPDWPAPGATFGHTQGAWPLVLADETQVVKSDPPRHLHLLAKSRPFLVAHVRFDLAPERGGTRVTLDERPAGGLLEPVLLVPPGSLTTRVRNRETLRRLRRLAEAC